MELRLKRCPYFVWMSLCVLASFQVSADDLVTRDGRFRLVPEIDLPVMAVSAAAILSPAAWDKTLGGGSPDASDRAAVNGFDRIATRQWSPAAATTSDVLLYSSCVLPFAATLADVLVRDRDARDFAVDAGIVAESILVAGGLTNVVKYAVHRARPLVYNPAAPASMRVKADSRLSFWSGHTATTAAALVSLAYVHWTHRPGTWSGWLAVGGAAAFVPAVATLRVAAGRHFPTDVLAGAAVGTAVGVLVPWLHRGDGKARVSVDPVVLPGGSGVALSAGW